jgi:hypothetical protein
MSTQTITDTISAQNTFSTGKVFEGFINVTLSGTFSATVTVQKSFDNSTWHDVISYTTAGAKTPLYEPEDVGSGLGGTYYRIGIKTGGYTSGDATCRLSN